MVSSSKRLLTLLLASVVVSGKAKTKANVSFLNHPTQRKTKKTDGTSTTMTLPSMSNWNQNRKLPPSQERCDAAFMSCVPDRDCFQCFSSLREKGVDWATVNPWTPCSDVIGVLTKAGHCKSLKKQGEDLFCRTFDSCVVWEVVEDIPEGAEEDEDRLDCSKLTSCEWEGMHAAFVGDGTCHDRECYNTEVCGFDGGDCCEDTCEGNDFSACGVDGYMCRDPESENCVTCASITEEEEIISESEVCQDNEIAFKLLMYDSWGDGWDTTELRISHAEDNADPVFDGRLETGSEGSVNLCLKEGCYTSSIGGGIWGNEVSWELRPGVRAGPPIAYGGAPMECTFSVAGQFCDNTCQGMPDNFVPDEEYQSYQQLSKCIADKCAVQFGLCKDDSQCLPCLTEQAPEFCPTNQNYINVVDCTLCSCAPEKPEFCYEKAPVGQKDFIPQNTKEEPTTLSDSCNSEETLKGSEAVLHYSQCSDIDKVTALVSNWNEDNFGPLDAFEDCAHSYANDVAHGGKSPLDCMRILENTANSNNEGADGAAIWEMANSLYKESESFCNCAAESNRICPNCDSFIHFKTLLHETLDACLALDQIDCAAWSQFYETCKDNVVNKFKKVDFTKKEQCTFVRDEECGGSGPFPAFRRLDCGTEIPKPAWDFYTLYSRSCDKDHAVSSSSTTSTTKTTKPKNTSSTSSSSSTTATTPSAHPLLEKIAKDAQEQATNTQVSDPYTGNSEGSSIAASTKSHKYHSSDSGGSHHFLWFLAICSTFGGIYYYRKNYSSSEFDFARFQRYQNNRFMNRGQGDEAMYSGLTEGSSFEPPTLPPALS